MRSTAKTFFLVWLGAFPALAATTGGATAASSALASMNAGDTSPSIPGTAGSVDLFTGTFNQDYLVPVVEGRHGMQPMINLHYRSSNGNGLVGVGWELELGAIERRTKGGVVYFGNEQFVLRSAGVTVDLVSIGGGEYRAQIESNFLRVRKLNAADGTTYWEVTDRGGNRSLYGESTASRQDSGNNIFRWAIDHSQDPYGNYMDFHYQKNGSRLYPLEIDYAGHTSGIAPANSVTFLWEVRPDSVTDYLPNFAETTALRLRGIYSNVGGLPVRRCQFNYDVSSRTGRSLLTSITEFGKDDASALPATSFEWVNPFNQSVLQQPGSGSYGDWASSGYAMRPTDVDGDGYDDVVVGPDSSGRWFVMKGGAQGFHNDANPWITGFFGKWAGNAPAQSHIMVADMTGDAKQDFIVGPDNDLNINNWPGNWSLLTLNAAGNGFTAYSLGQNLYPEWGDHPARVRALDVDGDGKADVLLGPDGNGNWYILHSGGAFFDRSGLYASGLYGNFSSDDDQWRMLVADVTGDGLPDIVLGPDDNGNWFVMENTKTGFRDRGIWYSSGQSVFNYLVNHSFATVADVNGDGKMDIVIGPRNDGNWTALISTGSSFVAQSFAGSAYGGTDQNRVHAIDVNGDGLTDIVVGPDSSGNMFLMRSTGTSFVDAGLVLHGSTLADWDNLLSQGNVRALDVNGDGSTEVVFGPTSAGVWLSTQMYGATPDLLGAVRNGYGGRTSVTYQPSTRFHETQLPFSQQVVMSTSADDGNGLVATVQYSYSGGYFNVAEKDFRGFASATVLGPLWPNGARTQTTTYFHQGNDTGVGVNDPSGAIGYMKGKPYRVTAGDTSSAAYTLTETIYQPAVGPSYFAPASDVYSSFCSTPGVCARQTHVKYQYDGYGNIVREDQYGDTSDTSDDLTVIRTFAPNTSAWILSAACNESTYTGTDTASPPVANKIAGIDYKYDGLASCSPSMPPSAGSVTWKSRYLAGGTNPVTQAAFDSYGNLIAITDAAGAIQSIAYDATHTYPTRVTNPLGQVASTTYYGIDGVPWSGAASDPGFFGSPQTMTDANRVVSTFSYDVFGRRVAESDPDGMVSTWSFNSAGSVGSQNVTHSSPQGIAENYFDGMGRTIKTRRRGSPTGRAVITETRFLAAGPPAQVRAPYFETASPTAWATYQYDAMARVVRTVAADGTITTGCYDDFTGAAATIDGNGVKHRTVTDVHKRPVELDEYMTTPGSCSATLDTPYARTTYKYLPLETDVFNAVSNAVQPPTSPSVVTYYDTLGRTLETADPDLGSWNFTYDSSGNLKLQTDGNGRGLLFDYDPAGRQTRKHACTSQPLSLAACQAEPLSSADVITLYDDPAIPFGIGRVSRVTDASGTTSFAYDNIGRVVGKTQTITGSWGSTTFTTARSFDASRRLSAVTYPQPDGSRISYTYDADGNLSLVSDATTTYAALSNYNAVAQMGTITFGDASSMSYSYDPNNGRLVRAASAKSGTPVVDLTYSYDGNGNVLAMTDAVVANNTQRFRYDGLNRLTWAASNGYVPNGLPPQGITYTYDPVRSHVLKRTSNVSGNYGFDGNGNNTTAGGRTIVWDAENRPASVTIGGGVPVTFVYDGTGARVVKQQGSNIVLYSDTFLTCTNPPSCTQYTRSIFAGSKRIAEVASSGSATYYEADGTNSTRATTGAQIARAVYAPFGSAVTDGTAVRYKFTGQEYDSEIGLYNYGARLYDPFLGRFISADTVVPGSNPQALNRYAYAFNNPVKYGDPSGHMPQMLIGAIIGAAVGAIDGIVTGQNLKGIAEDTAIGAAAGAVAAGTGVLVGPAFPAGAAKIVATSTIAGATSGGTAGVMGAAMSGSSVGSGFLHGVELGTLSGAVTGGVLAAGHIGLNGITVGDEAKAAISGIHKLQVIPNALAAPVGGYVAGMVECGAGCGWRGFLEAFLATTAQGMARDLGWYGGRDGRAPPDGSAAQQQLARDGVLVVTSSTSIDKSDWFFRTWAWLSGSGSHTMQFADPGGSGADRPYFEITRNAPAANMTMTPQMGMLDFFFEANCTTRYGYLMPGSLFNAYRFTGVGYYWTPH